MSKKMKKEIPTHDPQTGELNPLYEGLTGKPNPYKVTLPTAMTTKQWRTFSELQYVRGRLDEQYKLLSMIDLDMHGARVLDARISKYLTKMRTIDPMAYELYKIERENTSRSIERKG